MGNSETTITTSTDGHDQVEQPTQPSVVMGGTSPAMESATIGHAEEIANIKNHLAQTSARQDQFEANQSQLQQSVGSLTETMQQQMQGLTEAISGLSGKVGQGVQSAVENVSEVVSEVPEKVADMVPGIKEHKFFQRWGSKGE
jgi:hypothetical protein